MKKYYTLCIALLLGMSLWAVDANDFVIATFSQYQIRYAGSNYNENIDSMSSWIT